MLLRIIRRELSGTGDGVEHLAVLVEHVQAEGVGGDGHEGPAGLGAAEDGALDRLHVAAQRTGGVDHVVDVTAFLADVLEGMQMSADVHIHVVMFEKHGVHALLHCRHRSDGGPLR